MQSRLRIYLALGLASFCSVAGHTQSGIERYGEPLVPLSNVVTFDCSASPGGDQNRVQVFGAHMVVPKNFQPGSGEDNWFYWNVRLKAEDGSIFDVPLVKIHVGEYDNVSLSDYFKGFKTIAYPESNHLNVRVVLREPEPSDMSGTYWLYFLKESEFLKIISYDRVDWQSLLACF